MGGDERRSWAWALGLLVDARLACRERLMGAALYERVRHGVSVGRRLATHEFDRL